MPTEQQLTDVAGALLGYVWWTGKNGYKLRRSQGHPKSGRAPLYHLFCPDGTSKKKRFWTDEEAIIWAKEAPNVSTL